MGSDAVPLPPLVDVDGLALVERILAKCGAETVSRVLYKGVEGVYAEGEGGWVWIGVRSGTLVIRGKGSYYARARRCIKRLLVDAYYYSGRAHIYFIYAGEESLSPRLRESVVKKVARKVFAENMVYMFFSAAVLSMLIYSVFGPLLAPLALAAVAVTAIVFSPFVLPPLLSDWRLAPGEKVVVLDISIPGGVYREIYPRLDRRKLVEAKTLLWGYLEEGVPPDASTVERVLAGLLGVSSIPGIKVEERAVDVYGELSRVCRGLGASPPRGVYLYNVIAKNALSMGVKAASSIIVTSGLLALLDGGEVAAVLGHEESHLHRMDLLVFTAAVSAEYAFRLYFFFLYRPELLLNMPLIAGYLVFTGTLLFLLAKLLEIRADVDVARIGLASRLADSLVKIGYPSLVEEKGSVARLFEWLSWRPHPPLRYRVAYARELASRPPRHVWATALKLLLRGLLTAA